MSKEQYDKLYEPSPHIQMDHRPIFAAEYSAHHLGRISKALERIADALEKRDEKVDGGGF